MINTTYLVLCLHLVKLSPSFGLASRENTAVIDNHEVNRISGKKNGKYHSSFWLVPMMSAKHLIMFPVI